MTAPSQSQAPPATVADEAFARALNHDEKVWLLAWLSHENPELVSRGLSALARWRQGTAERQQERRRRMHRERKARQRTKAA